ncbi:MAG TPA: DinB family protein [Thermoanaerobaculia bacterium]|nr:DinB family protein [Thermoanaerobaculia bacterium]
MPIARTIAEEVEREAATTQRILERVPQDKLDWRPHAKSKSIGDLAYHIATLPSLGIMVLKQNELDPSKRSPLPRDLPPAGAFRRNVDEFLSAVGAMDNDQMMQPFTFRFGDKVIAEAPKAGMLRNLLLNHTYHHRGQLSVYLRLLDIPVPSVYGPTADEGF